jgi:tyrosyl-tRNA synthetase
MDFIKELEWRGMLHDCTPGAKELLGSKKVVGYIGFDPTAPSITIGNFVQIQLLKLFQLSGHTPIILMGGATGRIGDPSGKDAERTLKTEDELDNNLQHQVEQMKRFLDFEGPNAARLVNNYDFYKEMDVLSFLRNVGKTLTVNYMMSKDSVKNRLETGISFTEFSYQLLQAYDFQCLYEKYGCVLQMGGSDQWGNITSGTEFIRRNIQGKAYAVTTPLLTKSDGKKFGKSEQGNLWLNAKMTSPYRFYQFWLNADDADIKSYTRYFTLRTQEEVLADEEAHQDDPRYLKRLLAEELTRRVHGDNAYDAAMSVSEILFNKKASKDQLEAMSKDDLATIAQEIPLYEVPRDLLGGTAADLLSSIEDAFASKSEVRRAIKGNAVSINKTKISDEAMIISAGDLLHNSYLFLENGKKNKMMIHVK